MNGYHIYIIECSYRAAYRAGEEEKGVTQGDKKNKTREFNWKKLFMCVPLFPGVEDIIVLLLCISSGRPAAGPPRSKRITVIHNHKGQRYYIVS